MANGTRRAKKKTAGAVADDSRHKDNGFNSKGFGIIGRYVAITTLLRVPAQAMKVLVSTNVWFLMMGGTATRRAGTVASTGGGRVLINSSRLSALRSRRRRDQSSRSAYGL